MELFEWKVVEAAFCRRRRAGVSAAQDCQSSSINGIHVMAIAIPPEPESSFRERFEVVDCTEPD